MKTTMEINLREAKIIASWQNLSAPQEYNYEESIALSKKITSFIKNSELKNCPFCGTYALLHERDICLGDRKSHTIVCQNNDCGIIIGWYKTEAEAREAWNRRA